MVASPILVTGFEPYGGRGINPANETMKSLDGRVLRKLIAQPCAGLFFGGDSTKAYWTRRIQAFATSGSGNRELRKLRQLSGMTALNRVSTPEDDGE